MQISARSYLTAGLTAVVGASAIAMAPALPSPALKSVQLPTAAVAEIALTGTSLPLEQIWNLLQAVPSGGGLNGIVNVVFSAVGTEFFTQALPLVTAVATDVATYLGGALTDVFTGGSIQIDFPGILSGVGTALGTGDVPGALQALTGGLSAPITQVVSTVFGSDFQAFLTNKVGTVLGSLPELLRSAVQKVLGLDIKPVTDAIAMAIAGLLPRISPAASAPAALVEAATIASTEPAIRPVEPAPVSSPVVAVPAGAAAESPDASTTPAPAESPAGGDATSSADKASSIVTGEPEAPALVTAEPVAVEPDLPGSDLTGSDLTGPDLTHTRVPHRGAAVAAGDASPAAPKTAPRHRGGA